MTMLGMTSMCYEGALHIKILVLLSILHLICSIIVLKPTLLVVWSLPVVLVVSPTQLIEQPTLM